MALVLKEHTDHVEKTAGAAFGIVYVHSYIGEIEITQCMDCDFMTILCTHRRCTWIGNFLFCDLCQKDCT